MRSYKQFCGVAKALDVVGERWTLLLIRDLMPGGRRYTDLLRGLPGITTNLLAKRLQHLEAHGLITRRSLPVPASSTVYELTERGRALEPVVLALGAFGAAALVDPADDHTSHRWLMVSLSRRFHDADPTPFSVSVRLLDTDYTLRWDGERLRARDGDQPAHARVVGPALLGVLAGRPQSTEGLEITGDPQAFARLLRGLGPA
jgi:DNA-binding HxlR family transcriptional regulator